MLIQILPTLALLSFTPNSTLYDTPVSYDFQLRESVTLTASAEMYASNSSYATYELQFDYVGTYFVDDGLQGSSVSCRILPHFDEYYFLNNIDEDRASWGFITSQAFTGESNQQWRFTLTANSISVSTPTLPDDDYEVIDEYIFNNDRGTEIVGYQLDTYCEVLLTGSQIAKECAAAIPVDFLENLQDTYNGGYAEGYERGKEAGIEIGMQTGENGMAMSNMFSLFGRAFASCASFFELKVFGTIPLYWFFLTPLFVAIVTLIMRMVKH